MEIAFKDQREIKEIQEEMDNKEIASLLDMSQTAVAVTLHRARHKLREQLGEFVGGMDS